MTNLNASLRWLERESENLSFGEVRLLVVVHDGKIKRIEKTITAKEQITEDEGFSFLKKKAGTIGSPPTLLN